MAGGITNINQSVDELKAGPVKTAHLLLDAAATAALGQVIQFNTTENNYDDYTAGSTAQHYAVVAEAKTLAADTRVLCIVQGEVKLNKLDSTAQADDEIEAALLKSGIIPRANQSA